MNYNDDLELINRTMPAYAIASGHQQTSQAAAQILQQGGNAFDAILAAMMMSFVAEPLLASPGGGGYMLAAETGQKPQAFSFFPQTPSVNPADLNAADLDFYPINGDFGDRHQEFHIGADAAATPNSVAGIYTIHKHLASLPLSILAQPAIQAAKNGVVINSQQAFVAQILTPIINSNDTTQKVFGGMKVNTVWKNELLSRFLDTLSKQDHDWFYKGEIAESICKNSLLTTEDFEKVTVNVSDTLHKNINGNSVHTTPSSGGQVILEQLLASQNKNSGNLTRLSAMKSEELTRQAALVTRGTTHISVVDRHGNMASLTQSNGEGNGIVLPEHGFMMNNFLGEEDINPGGFFAWQPDDPLRSMMAPSLIINDDMGMALGTGGSNRIKTTLFQVIHRVCHGESLKNAINAPRFHYEKNHLDIEPGFSDTDATELKAQCTNHLQFEQPSLYFGGVNAAQTGKATLGYADFRRHGCGITGF